MVLLGSVGLGNLVGFGGSNPNFVSTWDTTQPGEVNTSLLNLHLDASPTNDCTVHWGDGSSETLVGTGTALGIRIPHTYSTPGTYTVTIVGQFGGLFFNSTATTLNSRRKLVGISNFGDNYNWRITQFGTFYFCSNLVISATSIKNAVSNNMSGVFRGINSTRVPDLDTSGASTFVNCHRTNSSLTVFPNHNFNSTNSLVAAFQDCSALANVPANRFDGCLASATFTNCFTGCALTETSVNNILVSIDSIGSSNKILGLAGGTNAAPTGAGITARDNLISRGWTVLTN